MKKKNREKYLKGFNDSLLMIWPLLRSYNPEQPSGPFHSTLEGVEFENSSDVIR
ncbi:hypothetical protein M758_4G219800 [Ceratodon purpureus]|nr:hypothetical protein M758_4G219800 [Ceratodon purpureus]